MICRHPDMSLPLFKLSNYYLPKFARLCIFWNMNPEYAELAVSTVFKYNGQMNGRPLFSLDIL